MYVDLVVTAPLVFVCRRIAKRVIPGVPIKSIGGHVLTRKESLPRLESRTGEVPTTIFCSSPKSKEKLKESLTGLWDVWERQP